MRTVFMGSPEFAVKSLEALHAQTEVVAVVCQPDKPAGRGLELLPPAVKVAAQRLGLPVLQPVALRPSKSDFVKELLALGPELVVVTAYGKILPPEVLAVPRHGCWNVHASLLPKYRGAAPIQWAILRGERETGITLMQMDAGMDTGAMLMKRSLPIDPEHDTGGSLHDKLSRLGGELLGEGLSLLRAGRPPLAEPQDPALATLAPKLEKEHGRADFTRPSAAVICQLHAVDPWPGGYTTLPTELGTLPDGQPLTLRLFAPQLSVGSGAPGTVLGIDGRGLHVACASGAVVIAELQLPGRKRMKAAALASGFKLPVGTRLGDGQPNPFLA